jgi:glycosyltransferase involved in cell wall biosynthesis
MTISFIITTYNVAPYIDQCLDSLLSCLRPGDEVILVDDGSTDQTDTIAERRFAVGFGPDVTPRLILLGTNTYGGVGIAANIGLTHATKDAVFFIDGDDWLVPDGFLACRAAFEVLQPDILICNYLEYDDKNSVAKAPSDLNRWSALLTAPDTEEARRKIALSMIAVPWRKFYHRDFLVKTGIRFPEGDFFFEDNPFHWQICRSAGSIRFLDRALCLHRVNRPGQTMAASGTEFLAFFDHYETICQSIPETDAALRTAALEWLVNNMSWHIGRMNHGAFWAYAARAAAALDGKAAHWATIRKQYTGSAIGGMVDALINGQIAGTVAAWMAERTQQSLSATERRLRGVITDQLAIQTRKMTNTDDTTSRTDKSSEPVQALRLIEEFRALRALHGAVPSETPENHRAITP